MSNSYKYLDQDCIYTDPKTGILLNLLNISDPVILSFVESGAVTKRLQELYEKPIKINGFENLFEIHKELFQDIYIWAGKRRIVEISKDGKQFFPISYFDNAFVYINHLISDYKKLKKEETRKIAEILAEILDNINYLHPFRDGNGRTQREFIRLLALEKNLKLNLNPPDNKNVYEKYMKGTIESDLKILFELIYEQINAENQQLEIG